jgi:hypothetical protein
VLGASRYELASLHHQSAYQGSEGQRVNSWPYGNINYYFGVRFSENAHNWFIADKDYQWCGSVVLTIYDKYLPEVRTGKAQGCSQFFVQVNPGTYFLRHRACENCNASGASICIGLDGNVFASKL